MGAWRDIELGDLGGGFRVDLPEYSPQFPARQSADLANVIVREGVSRKWPGYLRHSTAALANPVRFLADFALSNGSRHLVASDGRDIYQFVPGGPSWTPITPTYDAGTCSRPALSLVVTGAGGAAWVTAGIRAGDIIVCGTDSAEVDHVVGETELHLTAAIAGAWAAGSTYTIRQRLSSTGEYWLRAVVGDDLLIIVNGVDAALQWDGATPTMVPLGGSPPVARFIATFHSRNLMVLANLSTDHQRIQNSDADDYEEWAAGLAASYDFHAQAGNISGIDGGADFLNLFFEGGIRRGAWSGTDVAMEWPQVPTRDGVAAPNSLIRLGAQARVLSEGALSLWAYWGIDNIYSYDQESTQAIADSVRAWVWDRLDPAYLDRIQSVCVPDWHLALWSFPTKGNGGVCTHSIALDYSTGEWFPADVGFTSFGSYDLDAGDVQWDSLVGAIDSQTRVFDLTGSLPEPVTLCADDSGRVYYLAWGQDRDGTAISGRRRIRLPRSPRGRAMEIGELWVTTTATRGTRLVAELLGGDNPERLTTLERRETTVLLGGEVRFGFNSSAKHLAVVMSNAEGHRELGLVSGGVRMRERNR